MEKHFTLLVGVLLTLVMKYLYSRWHSARKRDKITYWIIEAKGRLLSGNVRWTLKALAEVGKVIGHEINPDVGKFYPAQVREHIVEEMLYELKGSIVTFLSLWEDQITTASINTEFEAIIADLVDRL